MLKDAIIRVNGEIEIESRFYQNVIENVNKTVGIYGATRSGHL